ncbi:glutamate--tRNA ligase [Candidatus Microgenomates bacterium]|nr:glutamate--tRNA ligase [Candidatus Microgenomates bacterium]
MTKVRVRFAPSPTGLLHLGGLRTALFDWLFAAQQGGQFILRLEDTDRERLVPEAATYIQDSLRWLGLNWQEGPDVGGPYGPYVQSERLAIYQKYADQLLEQGRMYRDWTTPEQLETMRAKATQAKQAFRIVRSQLITNGDPKQPHVLRFRIDETYNPQWTDLVRGHLSQQASELDDFVAIKSDGYPTYNFANVIDDHLMEISHVIRGDEFIASTPKFLQVYRALDWQPPQFAHLPQVLGPDKTKLSKRHGAEPALVYRDRGYLPAAVINFLAQLGWNDGTTQEVYQVDELIEKFSFGRVQRSPAIFDIERLNWLNGAHIRRLPIAELVKRAKPFWPAAAKVADAKQKLRILEVLQDRLKFLAELEPLSSYFWTAKVSPKVIKQAAANFPAADGELTLTSWLDEVIAAIKSQPTERSQLETTLKAAVAGHSQLKPAALWVPLRLILTNGAEQSPPIWDLAYALGQTATLDRLAQARKVL